VVKGMISPRTNSFHPSCSIDETGSPRFFPQIAPAVLVVGGEHVVVAPADLHDPVAAIEDHANRIGEPRRAVRKPLIEVEPAVAVVRPAGVRIA
jgi:hypothetical protein